MLGVKTGTRVSDVRSDLEAYGGHDPTVKGFATIDNVSLISIEVCVGQLLTERAVQCSASEKEVSPSSTCKNRHARIISTPALYPLALCASNKRWAALPAQGSAASGYLYACAHLKTHEDSCGETDIISILKPAPETQGTGMVGVPGIASTIFSTVRDANINVIMISQASSEQSIWYVQARP
jgi:hypothetical protein